MKNLMGAMEGGANPAFTDLADAMKAEQKVFFFLLSSPFTCGWQEFELICCEWDLNRVYLEPQGGRRRLNQERSLWSLHQTSQVLVGLALATKTACFSLWYT